MINKGYDQYMRSKIMTATKPELTLMLYEGAIKFCNMAISCIDKGDVPGAHTNIVKAEAIIEEFQATLDDKYEVSKDFKNVYDCIYDRLVRGNLKKDKELINEALGYLRTMRDAWKEVMRLSNQQGQQNPQAQQNQLV